MTNRIAHGGDLSRASARFGEPADGWLDLSTGINPVPYPVGEVNDEMWQRLPDAGCEQTLLNAARAYYGVPACAKIVATPGTQAIIQWLPRLRPSGTVQVVGPTYGEYAQQWRAAGHTVADVREPGKSDVIVICNPNNPDGRTWSSTALLGIAEDQAERGGWLVVDEAFSDVAPNISVAGHAGTPGLIVLRSFGKFFGLAGLRLGFALASADIADLLAEALGPWAVSGPALDIGTRALNDTNWQTETRQRLSMDSERLDARLSGAGFDVLGGTPLYRLTVRPDARDWHERLARHGVLTRRFPEHPTWLRFGLPGSTVDWKRLEVALDS